MNRLPFRRVLLGALLGALAMLGIWMLIHGPLVIVNRRPLHGWIVPLGAVLGIRLAVGKGGTARWAALLASLVLGWFFMWVCLEWAAEGWGRPDIQYGLNLLILLGGWSVLVWRAMDKLEGGGLSMEALPLTLIGLFVANLIDGVVGGLMSRSASLWLSGPLQPMSRVLILGALYSLMLVGGLGSMAALAGRLDVRWGNACMCAGLFGMVMVGGWLMMESYGPVGLRSWMFLAFRLVFELAWFSWWGWRLAKGDGSE